MAKTFQLTISNVAGPVFADEAVAVSVPGVAGDMQILAEHAALISPLRTGTIIITKADNTTAEISLENGTLEVSDNQVTIIM